jgi:hypothetical protein
MHQSFITRRWPRPETGLAMTNFDEMSKYFTELDFNSITEISLRCPCGRDGAACLSPKGKCSWGE